MQSAFRLGDWVVQAAQCRLSKDGRTLQARAMVMDLLVYLADNRGEDLVFLRIDPKWDPYRSDPRFQAVLDWCGFMTPNRERSTD